MKLKDRVETTRKDDPHESKTVRRAVFELKGSNGARAGLASYRDAWLRVIEDSYAGRFEVAMKATQAEPKAAGLLDEK